MNDWNQDSTWSYGTISKRLRETTYATVSEMPEYGFYQTERGVSPSDAPWPAFEVACGFDVHLIPRTDHLMVWLVESETSEIAVSGGMEGGSILSDEGPSQLATTLRRCIESHDVELNPSDITEISERAKEAAEQVFADPFDAALRRSLRRPQARALIRRTANVEAALDEDGDTSWTITLSPDPDSTLEADWEPSYTTEQLTNEYATVFTREYRNYFQNRPDFGGSGHQALNIWFSITWDWLDEDALVRSYADHDLLDVSIDDYEFCRSPSETFHLCHSEDEDLHGCRNARGMSVDFKAPASLYRTPVPTVLCPHCSQLLKELRVDSTLRQNGY